MSNYDPQAWQVPMKEAIWNPTSPTSGVASSHSASQSGQQTPIHRENERAFNTQFEEVSRAADNLMKSGKFYPSQFRRDSLPMMGPPSFEMGPRMAHRHSIDYDRMGPPPAPPLQSYYANQRQQPRPNETEQMMQAKRRMAAQRERELRNYHQEQQYNRNTNVQARQEGPMSPGSMSEDDRKDLIARQHRALYGSDPPFYEQGHQSRASNPTSGHSSATGGRGPSPRTYDPFGIGPNQQQGKADEGAQLNPNGSTQQGTKGPSPKPAQPTRPLDETAASPASNPPSQNFNLFEGAQQSSRTSTSSPGGSPPRPGAVGKPNVGNSGVAPIGTRPNVLGNAPSVNPPLMSSKQRNNTSSSQSPLGFGFSTDMRPSHHHPGNDAFSPGPASAHPANDKTASSASSPTPHHHHHPSSSAHNISFGNPTTSGAASKEPPTPVTSAWGTSSEVWGTAPSSSGGNNNGNKSIGAVWG